MQAGILAGILATYPIDVDVRGALNAADVELACSSVAQVFAAQRLSLAGTRIRLAASACGRGPALMQVNLRVDGMPARIQVPGRSVSAAVAAAAERLDRQIRRVKGPWEDWRWPDPQRRPLTAPFDGAIARVKAASLVSMTPQRAAFVMSAMDYAVHLFTDAQTGQDAVIYRAGPTGVRLARQRAMRPPANPGALTVNPYRVATLTADHAAARLVECGQAFVFFTELATQRGNLLYRRYDGDLTLVRPHIEGEGA